MGASAALLREDLDAFESGVRESVSSPLAPALTAKQAWLASVDDLVARTRDYRKHTEKLRAGLERFVVSLATDPSGIDINDVIMTLKAVERDTVAEASPHIQRVRATRNKIFSSRALTPGERARGIAAVDMYIAAFNDSLAMLRDFRWRIMAIRANFEEAGNAPVFDDPEKLIEYLDSHAN